MKRLRAVVDRLLRSVRERWQWYLEQRRQDQERHWWDVYNR
ncbi:MAG TPA: hypothetical protein VGQ25_12690 [Gemmatimonadales bacterium]|nr:hypothetical protein [Gemmatimonadales bacterium]